MITQIIPSILTLLDKVIPDKAAREKLAHNLAQLTENHAQARALAQIEINKIEARSVNWFQASWRPAVGWVCVSGFAVNFLVSPIAAGFGVDIPQADMATMMPILAGLLGLGSLRTFEKTKGVNK